MKKCTFEKYMLSFMTHELSSEEYDEVSSHVAECRRCASILAEMQGVEDLLHAYQRPKVPESIYAEYMRGINRHFGQAPLWQRLLGAVRSFTTSMALSRAVGYRLARTFTILLLGVMIGRYVVLQPGSRPPVAEHPEVQTPALTSADLRQLNDYFVQAEQLLLTIANTPDNGASDDDLILNKDVAKQLLVKSTSMQRKAGVLDDDSITIFLNHLEFILLEMSNREDDKIHSAFHEIREMVNEADLVKKSMQMQEKMARSLSASA